MKTIKRKAAVLTFTEMISDSSDAQTYEVSLGTQRLGLVSYQLSGDAVSITELIVESEFESFGVEQQIRDALHVLLNEKNEV